MASTPRKHSKARILAKTAGGLTANELATLHHHTRKAMRDQAAGDIAYQYAGETGEATIDQILAPVPDELEDPCGLLGDVRNPIP